MWGTTGYQASHVELKEMPSPAARYPIKGISRISNVEFEQGLNENLADLWYWKGQANAN